MKEIKAEKIEEGEIKPEMEAEVKELDELKAATAEVTEVKVEKVEEGKVEAGSKAEVKELDKPVEAIKEDSGIKAEKIEKGEVEKESKAKVDELGKPETAREDTKTDDLKEKSSVKKTRRKSKPKVDIKKEAEKEVSTEINKTGKMEESLKTKDDKTTKSKIVVNLEKESVKLEKIASPLKMEIVKLENLKPLNAEMHDVKSETKKLRKKSKEKLDVETLPKKKAADIQEENKEKLNRIEATKLEHIVIIKPPEMIKPSIQTIDLPKSFLPEISEIKSDKVKGRKLKKKVDSKFEEKDDLTEVKTDETSVDKLKDQQTEIGTTEEKTPKSMEVIKEMVYEETVKLHIDRIDKSEVDEKKSEEALISTEEKFGTINKKIPETLQKTEEILDKKELVTKAELFKKQDTLADMPEEKQKVCKKITRESKRKPTFDVKLSNRTAASGDSVKLTCSVSGDDITLQWYKDKISISSSQKYNITTKNGISSLEISNLTTEDTGVYTCIGTNRLGEVETSSLVTVYESPKHGPGNTSPPIFTRRIQVIDITSNRAVDKRITRSSTTSESLEIVKMGETEGDPQPTTESTETKDSKSSPGLDERSSPAPGQDNLQVPTGKRRRIKSPTPGSLRGRSMTPIRGRSQTPFSLYLNRRSATPATWRSITPFINREDKEKTPFELGKSIKPQLICNKAVFDKALIMDITEPEVEPVRYITTDMCVIDRAAVMDISNVEVIYVVEEYEEEYEEEEEEGEKPEEEKKKKKKKKKEKTEKKKKEKKEKSPSPKLTLKLEIGGGAMQSKKLFQEQEKKAALEKDQAKPPPKKKTKSKFQQQMEENAKLAKAAAEKEAKAKAELEAKKKEKEKKRQEREEARKKRILEAIEERNRQEEEDREKKKEEERLIIEEEEKARQAEKAMRLARGESLEIIERELEAAAEKAAADRAAAYEKAAAEAAEAVAALEAELAEEEEGEEEEEEEGAAEGEVDEGGEGAEAGEGGEAAEAGGEEEEAGSEAGEGEQEGDEAGESDGGENSEDEQEGGEETAEILARRQRRLKEKGEIEVEVQTPDILDKIRKRRQTKDTKEEEPKEEVKVEKPKKVEPPPPDPEDIRWKEIASEIGEEIAVIMRKFCKENPPLGRGYETRPPIISFSLSDAATQEGNPVKLQCAAYGSNISYKWLRDGKTFDRGPRIRITQFNIDSYNVVLTAEMFGTTPQDSAEYSCVVSNSAGEATTSCMVSIYQVFKDEPSPPTINYITEHYHLYDDELTIECQCHGIPRPKVTWFKDNYELKKSFKYSMLEEAHGIYKLLIYQPTVKDNGQYVCRVINDSGQQEVSHTVEFVKPKTFHLHHAHGEVGKETAAIAKQPTEEGKKSEKRVRAPTEEVLVPPKNKLIIATQLRDRTALEGGTVKLMCNIIGPNPAVRWYKNDEPLQMGPTIRNLSTEGKPILELLKVTIESSGLYKCVAKNQYSEVDTQCYLKVYSAKVEGNKQDPMFVLPIRDVYHLSENDLIIDTKVRGNPRPTILWLKDEMPVVLDTRVQQIEHIDGICELIINKPTLKDSGNYSCVAENSLGLAKISHTVVVDVPPPTKKFSGPGSMSEEREISIKAKKEEETAEQKGKSAKGKKKAEPSGEEGGRRRQPMPEPSPKDKLYFIAFLTNRYLEEGSKVKLSAVVGGRDPQIKWLKDGNNVQYSPRIRNMSRESLAVLEITNAKIEDSGEYTVVARNSANEISSSARLHIYESKVSTDLEPLFTRALKETYHLNTNELILETHVRGNPTPTIVWLKDSVEIEISKKYQIIDHSDGTCELIIDKPNNRDSGKYVCKAENSVGQAEISHYVLFEGKESYIADNIHGIFHADKSLMKSKENTKEEDKAKDEKEKEGKGKGKAKGKGKGGKAEESEPATKSSSAREEKPEKREKRIGIHFDANLTDRVVAEGSRVKLTCSVQGTSPAIKWLRDDQAVQYGPKIRQFYREGLCILELLNPTVDDTGIYKCYAKDNTGEATTICKLTVYSRPGSADIPPTFTRSIKDTYHGKVNELVLDCHVRGLPTPSISWVKDGVKIEPCAKFRQIEHADGTCELIINDPLPFDSGKYVCQAENRVNAAEISHVVQIQAKDIRPGSPIREIIPKQEKPAEAKEEKKDEKKKKKAPLESGGRARRSAAPPPDPRKQLYFGSFLANRVAAEGTKVRLSIYINGPDPQVRWFKNDNPVTYGPKTQAVCQNGLAVLVLQKLTEEDSGEYKIVARNSESEISTACTLMVYKTAQEESAPPVFSAGIKDTYYLGENELVLDCRVRGNPHPKIEWLKNNELIVSSSKYRQLDQADGYCKLIINDPTEKDSGVYTCRAENPVSTEKVSHTVDFAGRERFILEKTHGFFHRDPNKPHLTTPLGNHIVTAGGTIAIQAEFLPTYSPIEVQWLRNKAPITADPNIKTFAEHGVYTLAVEKASRDFSGTYTCRASNAFGKIETHANVHIIGPVIKGGKPALFLSRPESEMTALINNPVSISFRVQGDPKPKLVFMKGTKDITQSERVSKEVSEDYIRFTLHKAQISDSGTYFVVARNDHGTDRIFVTVTIKNPPKITKTSKTQKKKK